MSNPLGRFLNGDAQKLTEQIDDATNAPVAASEAAKVLEGMSVDSERDDRDFDSSLGESIDVNTGAVSSEISPREIFSEAVTPEVVSSGVFSPETVSPDIVSPEEVSKEFAHERKLASDEGDKLVMNPELLSEALNDSGENIYRNGENRHNEEHWDSDGREDVLEEDVLTDREAVLGWNTDVEPENSSMVNKDFVGGDKELAKRTMSQVEDAVSHRGDVPIMSILLPYERGADAMRQDDERVA